MDRRRRRSSYSRGRNAGLQEKQSPLFTSRPNRYVPRGKNFDVLDMGEGARVYSPIRITMDELSDRTNEGIMWMNDKIEEVIVESCLKGAGLKKDDKKKK